MGFFRADGAARLLDFAFRKHVLNICFIASCYLIKWRKVAWRLKDEHWADSIRKEKCLAWLMHLLFYKIQEVLCREDPIAFSKSKQKSVSFPSQKSPFFLPRWAHIQLAFTISQTHIDRFAILWKKRAQPSPISPKAFHRSFLFVFMMRHPCISHFYWSHHSSQNATHWAAVRVYNPYSFGAHFHMDHAWAKVIHMLPLQNDEGKFQSFSPFLLVSTGDFFSFILEQNKCINVACK